MNRIAAVFFASCLLGATALAQTTGAPSPSLALSEHEKQAVVEAAVEAKSRQKTPKEFTPALGADVPKELYLHGFKPEVTQANPALKNHLYAFIDREVVLIDGLQKKVVAVLPLPEKYVQRPQEHQGAAEPASTDAKGGAGTTGSVPAYTSPETIR